LAGGAWLAEREHTRWIGRTLRGMGVVALVILAITGTFFPASAAPLPLVSGQTLTRPTVVAPQSCALNLWVSDPPGNVAGAGHFVWQTYANWKGVCP